MMCEPQNIDELYLIRKNFSNKSFELKEKHTKIYIKLEPLLTEINNFMISAEMLITKKADKVSDETGPMEQSQQRTWHAEFTN
jgi:hypothetical protein